MADLFDELAGEQASDIFDELSRQGELDQEAQAQFRITPPTDPMGFSPEVIGGGPPVQLASFRETIAEPLETMRTSVLGEMPKIAPVGTTPGSSPMQPWENVLARSIPGNFLAQLNPELGAQLNRTIANQAIGLGEFITSPLGATATALAPAMPTTVAAGFTADMLKSLYEQGKQAYANWDQMTDPEKLDAAVNLGATGAMAVGAGKTAYKGARNWIKPPVPPQIPRSGAELQMPPGARPVIEPPPGRLLQEPVQLTQAEPARSAQMPPGARPTIEPGLATPIPSELLTLPEPVRSAVAQEAPKPVAEAAPAAPTAEPTPAPATPKPDVEAQGYKPIDAETQAQIGRHVEGAATLGRPVVELTGPDGVKRKATYDGSMMGHPQFTPLENLPGVKDVLSSTMGPTLTKGGYSWPKELPELTGKPVPVHPDYAPKAEPLPVAEAPKAEVTASPVPPQAKEPWQMTKDEWEGHERKGTARDFTDQFVSEAKAQEGIARKALDEANQDRKVLGNMESIRKVMSDREGALQRNQSRRNADKTVEAARQEFSKWSSRVVRRASHEGYIKRALESGKHVPTGVLADYPDLITAVSETKAPVAETVPPKAETTAPVGETAPALAARAERGGLTAQDLAATEAEIQGAPPSLAQQPLTPATPNPYAVDVKPISQIIRDMSKGLGVPIRFGRLRTPKYGGYFNKVANLIASKRPNEMPVVGHEAGHKLDALFKFSGDRSIANELDVLGDPQTAGSMSSWTSSKSRTYKMGEGVAEFTRYWLIDPARAKQAAPNMAKVFEQTLDANPDYGATMRQAQSDIQLWRTAPAQARLRSSISTSNPIPAHRGLSGLTRDLVDDLHVTRLMMDDARKAGPASPTQDVYQLARSLRGSYGMADSFIRNGVAKFGTKAVELGTSLEDALEPVSGQIANFRDWITAKRAQELQKQGKETGLVASDVDAVVRAYDGKPEFQEAFDKIQAWQEALLQYAVDAGMVSPEAAVTWREVHKDYVPFHRVMEIGANETAAQGGGAGTGRGLNVGKPGSTKALRGSKRDIIDPLETMVKNAYALITSSEKNAIHTALADLSKRQDMGKWVERVGAPKEAVKVELERIRKQLEDAGADLTKAPDDLLMTFFRASKRAPFGENIIAVNRAGKTEFYRLNKELYETFHALDQEAASQLVQYLSIPGQVLRAGVTLTPDFAMFNALRDTVSSAVLSKYTHVPFLNTLKGVAALFGNPQLVAEWAAAGGRQAVEAHYFDRAKLQRFLTEKITKDLTPAEQALVWTKSPLALLRKLTGTMEEATRIGEYQIAYDKLRKAGMPEGEARRQAAFDARDLQDFAKGGAQTKLLRRVTPFWNAALQGNFRLAQAIKQRPLQTAMKGFIWLTIPKLMEQAINWDDKDYWDRPQWERDSFFMIPYGKDANGRTQFIRLPTPFEAGIIFGTVPGRFMQYLKQNNLELARKGLATLLAKNALSNPLPQSVLTVLETMMGKQGYSLWRGRPIVPEALKDVAPQLQFTEQESLTAKKLGDLMGKSPAKIDYLIQGLTGGLGKQVVHKGIDPLISSVTGEPRTAVRTGPLSRFLTTPAGITSDAVERFYESLTEARQAESLSKAGRETGGREGNLKALEAAAKDIGELRREARQTADLDERQRIQLEIVNIAKEALAP